MITEITKENILEIFNDKNEKIKNLNTLIKGLLKSRTNEKDDTIHSVLLQCLNTDPIYRCNIDQIIQRSVFTGNNNSNLMEITNNINEKINIIKVKRRLENEINSFKSLIKSNKFHIDYSTLEKSLKEVVQIIKNIDESTKNIEVAKKNSHKIVLNNDKSVNIY